MDNITILVNSCDKYDDLWPPFFELMWKYWPDRKWEVILNTESKRYRHANHPEFDIKTFAPFEKDNKNHTWAKRLLWHLDRIETEFVLLLLDDFFIQNYVDQSRLDLIVNWISQDNNIACFYTFPYKGGYIKSDEYEGFVSLTNEGQFRVNCQAAIWRKSILQELLNADWSPWEFEELGSRKAQNSPYKFYCPLQNTNETNIDELIIPYSLYLTWGYGVWHGKWLFKNRELFDKNGIAADFSKRESFTSKEEVLQDIENRKQIMQQEEQYRRNHPLTSFVKRLCNFILRCIHIKGRKM